MAISGTTADEIGDALIIKLASPYKNVSCILSFEDDTTGENTYSFFQKSFRWSTDNVTYSDWLPLTDENLQKLELDPTKDFWIQYKYEVLMIATGHSLTFNSISLEVCTDAGTIKVAPMVECGNECDGVSNLVIECDDEPFNPYALGAANSTYQQLSCVVNELFGHEVKYFHFTPQSRSRDVILKEYSLYEGQEAKTIKISVPDNELPTREIQFQFDGLNMPDAPFEIHIVKSAFQAAFGDKARPGTQDVIWFPLMDRLYEVNSIALPDDFMLEASYYRVSLDLYQDRTNRLFDTEEAEAMEIELDDLSTGLEEVFAEEKKDELEKVRKDNQYNTVGTGKKDYVRKDINRNLLIKEYKIKNNFTVVSKYYYQLGTIGIGDVALTYRYNGGIPATEDRAFTFWYRPQFQVPEGTTTLIDNIGGSTDGKVVMEATSHGYQAGDFIRITGTTDYNGYHKILSVTDDTFTLNTDFVTGGGMIPKARKQEACEFLNYGQDSASTGFSITVMQKVIAITINNTDYIFETGFNAVNGQWYGVVVNFSNQFKQLSTFIYEVNQTTGLVSANTDSELKNLYNETQCFDESVAVEEGGEWKLLACHMDVTNLRIFSKPVEEEEHSLLLSQYVVADTHLTLMVDNAVPQLKLVSLGNPK